MRTSQLGLAGVGVLLLAIAACSEELETPTCSALRNITITARDFEPDASTRTDFKITDKGAEFAWAANDTVGIFPETGAQAYFPMTSGAGTKTASFSGGGWALKDAARYAAYYPFVGSFYLNREAIPVNYTGQKQVGNASTAHLGAYDYMAAAPATPQGGNANFAFNHLGCLVQLKLTVPQATPLTSVMISTEEALFAVEGTVNLMSDLVSITPTKRSSSIRLDLSNVATTADNQELTLYLMLPPTDLSGKELTVTATIQTEQKAVTTLTGKNLQAGRAYALAATLPAVDPSTHIQITKAGTLRSLIGDSWDKITALSVSGPLNGDDIRLIREMAGVDVDDNATDGSLTTLDMSKASIVSGGGAYSGSYYKTADNEIGGYMFYKSNLIAISLPENATIINHYAFFGCSNLKELNFPESLTTIEHSAFWGCTCLTTLNFPESLTTIEETAFTDCTGLTTVNFPELLTTIGALAFSGCTGLTTLTFPESLTTIENSAFKGCTGLTTLNFPETLTTIGYYAFWNCTGLTALTFPESLTTIGEGAFYGCTGLTTLNFPESLTTIERNAFGNCTGLTTLNFPESLISVNGFEGCTSLTKLNFPESLTGIGNFAFYGCTGLITIDFPKSLITIGSYAFMDCTGLTTLDFPDSLITIGKLAFEGCTGLTMLNFPESLTTIGESVFEGCTGLTTLNFPMSLESIGNWAFSGCAGLTTVKFPMSLESIGQGAFVSCTNLNTVYCYATTPPRLGNNVFNKSTSNKLYVNQRSVAAYVASSWNSYFYEIEAIDSLP